MLHRGVWQELWDTAWRWGSQSSRTGSRLLPSSTGGKTSVPARSWCQPAPSRDSTGQPESAPGRGASSTLGSVLRPLALSLPRQPAQGNRVLAHPITKKSEFAHLMTRLP